MEVDQLVESMKRMFIPRQVGFGHKQSGRGRPTPFHEVKAAHRSHAPVKPRQKDTALSEMLVDWATELDGSEPTRMEM